MENSNQSHQLSKTNKTICAWGDFFFFLWFFSFFFQIILWSNTLYLLIILHNRILVSSFNKLNFSIEQVIISFDLISNLIRGWFVLVYDGFSTCFEEQCKYPRPRNLNMMIGSRSALFSLRVKYVAFTFCLQGHIKKFLFSW